MNNVVPIGQAQRPAKLRERLSAGVAVNKNFSDGVRDSFPSLSIKGKVFRIRKDGNETPLIDPQTKQVIPYLDVVMVNASPMLAKAFYVKGFTDDETSFQAPDCWSLDSVRPDPSVANKMSPTCANCKMNEFGSAPSRDATAGKRGGKACSDSRRVAVVMPGHLGDANSEPLVFLLKVPATSLKNLKNYAQLLERQGWEPAACVTRLSFDYQEAYPKLLFNFVDGLDDKDYDRGVAIAESTAVSQMLAAPDFDIAASHVPAQNPVTAPRVVQQAPILEDPTVVTGTGGVPPVTNVASHIIELPEGELFDTTTGEYIQRPAPKVEMPALDPAIIPLPGGKFFNTTTRQYVSGQEVGSPPAAEVADVPKRKPRAKPAAKDEPAEMQAAPQNIQETPVDNPAPHTTSGVEPAPEVLESILDSILPKR